MAKVKGAEKVTVKRGGLATDPLVLSTTSHFENIVTLTKESGKNVIGLWNEFVLFVTEDLRTTVENDAKAAFKEKEKQTKEKDKFSLQEVGAYRSAKSVIMSALRYDIALADSQGKARGKTEIEKEIKDRKEPEAPIDTIKRSMSILDKKIPALTTKGDISLAYMLVKGAWDAINAKTAEVYPNKGELAKTIKLMKEKRAADAAGATH